MNETYFYFKCSYIVDEKSQKPNIAVPTGDYFDKSALPNNRKFYFYIILIIRRRLTASMRIHAWKKVVRHLFQESVFQFMTSNSRWPVQVTFGRATFRQLACQLQQQPAENIFFEEEVSQHDLKTSYIVYTFKMLICMGSLSMQIPKYTNLCINLLQKAVQSNIIVLIVHSTFKSS